MEMRSPPPCPNTVTVRRNPPRRARPTPYSAAPLSLPPSSSSSFKPSSAIRSFPIHDILSINVPDQLNIPEPSSSSEPSQSEKLKVFLRIRPIVITQQQKRRGSAGKTTVAQKNVWPRKKEVSRKTTKKKMDTKDEVCLKVIDSHSVTLSPPQSLADVRRIKSEVYEGFSHVFCPESTQSEVYEEMVKPLVKDFLKGKSGMLAALGPSGSGKTHTVFGSTREPGMVSLALRQIYIEKESNGSKCSRTFYLSMFEIYSERGKGEKIMDLSHDGGDLFMQQSNIKGLQEVVICDVQEAESLIANGMLKRSTAMTNSNIQSSRSQCIINIRCDFNNLDEDAAAQSCTAVLTIVDLAGAEREKRTGNQGSRLVESNFINNTSMVFGLCLRSLLEHQKNPKKPFHKHFQNSLLTKYLRDFLEGKKRMSLILTAKSGEEDYQDTSYLLRQASPYMNIKFENVEQPANTLGNKRRTQTFPKAEQAKRMKLNSDEVCLDDAAKGGILHQPRKEELTLEQDIELEANVSSSECPAVINIEAKDDNSLNNDFTALAKITRENQILSNFSRALWNVLKEYKTKLETSENAVESLRRSLNAEQERCSALETELDLMKASCSGIEENGSNTKSKNCSLQSIDVHQPNVQVHVSSSDHPVKLECSGSNILVTTSFVHLPDFSDTVNIENQADIQVSCSDLYEAEHVDSRHDTSSNVELTSTSTSTSSINVEVVSTSLNVEKCEEQSNKKENVPCEYVVFAKEDLKELGDLEFNTEVSGSDTVESTVNDSVSGSKLLVHEVEVSSFVKGDQVQHEEEELNSQVTSLDPNEFECFQKQDILDDIKQSGIFQIETHHLCKYTPKLIEAKLGCDTFESAVTDSELIVHGDETSSLVKGDLCQHKEEESSAQVSVSESCESDCVVKDVLEDSAGSSVEDVSISNDRGKCEEQINEKVDVSCPNAVLDEQEFKEVVEKEADGELADSSVLLPVAEDEKSSTLEEKEVVSDRKLVPEDVVSSRGCKTSKLPEAPSAQLCQPVTAMKPKRRLRPASSVMLRNINVLDFDDATEMPKQQNGKRGEKEDVGKKITPGSITLLRLLKPNLQH